MNWADECRVLSATPWVRIATPPKGRLKQAEGAAQNLYGQGREALREATHEASKYAADLYENAGTYVQEGGKVVRRQVHENPLSALLLAGLLGFLLGLSVRDRH